MTHRIGATELNIGLTNILTESTNIVSACKMLGVDADAFSGMLQGIGEFIKADPDSTPQDGLEVGVVIGFFVGLKAQRWEGHFLCASCHEMCEKEDGGEERAIKEFQRDHPDDNLEMADIATVCDECFRRLMASMN